MEDTSNELLAKLITDQMIGNLVYIIHTAGENVMHSVGVLESDDYSFFKLIPPSIEKIESLEKSTKNWLFENAIVLQFAEEYIERYTISVIKDLETTDEVLRKYVETEAAKIIEG